MRRAFASPAPAAARPRQAAGRATVAGAARAPLPRCACGGGCPRCAAPVAAAAAPQEARADRLAAQVMVAPAMTPLPAEPPRQNGPLPDTLRAFYEPRFGRSLAGIRLRSGGAAQREAADLRAHAFTYGREIVLGAHRPAQPSLTLAHELAHALHDDPHTVWREPYETRGIDLDAPASATRASGRAQIATLATRSYWEQRTLDSYELVVDPALTGELLDAALSVLWSMSPPATVRSRQVMLVPIAARTIPAPAQPPGSTAPPTPPPPTTTPEMVCRYTFDPPAARGRKPRLDVTRAASGTGMSPVAAPAAPAGFTPAVPRSFTFRGFATTDDDYYAAHPAEHQALFHWIENSAPASFSQLVTTTTEVATRGGGTRISHRSAFHVSGRHNGSDIASLTTTLVGETEVSPQQSAPAGYAGHGNAMNFEIEKLQARATDPLGVITLPAGIPADEVVPVREAVRQYFSAGNARNTEVDAIVPVGGGTRSVLYTLVFGAANAVSVTRIGEAGSGAGLLDVNRLDVTRVRGFPAAATPAQLRSWWSTRYPQGGALPSDATLTADALVTAMNALLAAGIANRSWFDTNYGIEVMDAAGTTARLRAAHNVPARQAGGTVDFDATDLRMLELALQTLTASELTRLRGVKLGRRTASLRRAGRGFAAGSATQYGVTFTEANGDVGSSRVDLQACKLEYSIVSPK